MRKGSMFQEMLVQQGSVNTPKVSFCARSGLLAMEGVSMPENLEAVYAPLHQWLASYVKRPAPRTVFSFRMVYYNTSTSRSILMLLEKLEHLYSTGREVEVHWYYPEDDYDMEEAGYEFSQNTVVPFRIQPEGGELADL